MKDEITKALKSLLLSSEKADPAVLQALGDPLAVRRVVAAEALLGAGGAKHWPAVRPRRTPTLRCGSTLRRHWSIPRTGRRCLRYRPIIELPRAEVSTPKNCFALAGSKAPAVPWGNDDEPARKKLGDAWQAWWKEHGAKVDLAELAKTRSSSGLTLVALSDGKRAGFGGFGGPAAAQAGKVVAIDRTGQVRWEIDNLDHPIDVQLLPGQRVLVAEYYGRRVTERDTKGKILWEVNLPSNPVNVQRLANGNTFIALYGTPAKANGQALIEVDPTGKTVASFAVPAGAPGAAGGFGLARDMVFAAQKIADGKIVCLTYDQNCVWMDATGKEIKRIAVPQTKGSSPLNTVGNIDVTAKGNVLFAHAGGLVKEYDADGKIVWQAKASGHRATRLANGNTLVALTSGGVVELDAAGRTVWQYDPPGGLQAIRARR